MIMLQLEEFYISIQD